MDEKTLRRIVRETVYETLSGLGFDPDEPQRMQANMLYLDKIRRGSEFMTVRIKLAAIATLVPTSLYLLWEAVKNIVIK